MIIAVPGARSDTMGGDMLLKMQIMKTVITVTTITLMSCKTKIVWETITFMTEKIIIIMQTQEIITMVHMVRLLFSIIVSARGADHT